MDKVYIGRGMAEFSPGLETLPITKVELLNENGEVVGVAGDDTGRVLTAANPDGTDAMAADILASVGGFVYRPYEGEDALIDPAAELGDGVTVGGIYSVLANENITFDGLYTSGISAPTMDEIEDEYPYLSEYQRIQRSIAGTRSLISKTAEQIRQEVANEVEGLSAAIEIELTEIIGRVEDTESDLSQTLRIGADNVTITNAAGDTLTIDGGQIDASKIKTEELDASKIKVTDLQLTGSISWSDLATDAQNQVTSAQNTALSAYSLANTANSNAASAASQVSAWTYGQTTYIDGSKIMTGTVMASYLQGGMINVKGANGVPYGIMYAGTNLAGTTAFELYGTNGLRLTSAGNIWLECNGGDGTMARINLTGQNAYIGPTVYLTNGTLIASDRDLKHDIEYDIAAYDAVFDALKPSRFKYNDGTSDRYHTALVAQDVKDAVLSAGLTTQDFAGYCEAPVYAKDENGNPTEEITGYTCALRYDEFIALNIRQIQQLKARVAELEARL